jgi:hypothetical protein
MLQLQLALLLFLILLISSSSSSSSSFPSVSDTVGPCAPAENLGISFNSDPKRAAVFRIGAH